jgi:hypothetical protein
MHILMYNIFVHQSDGRVRQIARAERARFAGESRGRAGNNVLCGQKFTQDVSFKIHLFLQNVLQNIVLSTSKSITFGCSYFIFYYFSYSCLSLGGNFATCSGFIGIYFGLSQ